MTAPFLICATAQYEDNEYRSKEMEQFLRAGVISSTHGIRGEVKVFPTTDDAARFKEIRKVFLDTGREQLELEIQSVRFFKQFVIVKFKGIDNINDIEKYKAYYCGLCHVLKEKYGKDGTNNLSYDMTFLTLLLTDLYNADIKGGFERCIAKPLKEHKYIISTYSEYAADMQMMLSYYSELDKQKDKDEDADSKKLKVLSAYIADIDKKYPRQAKCLKDGLMSLSEAEKNGEEVDFTFKAVFAQNAEHLKNIRFYIPPVQGTHIMENFINQFIKSEHTNKPINSLLDKQEINPLSL